MKMHMCIAAVLVFLLQSALVVADSLMPASPDTTYLLGGPDRWDGRFETAASEPDWHGWTHVDVHSFGNAIWQVSDFEAENLGGHGAGNLAAWCGTTFDNSCGPGYGNGWSARLVWTGTVPDPVAPTVVRIVARMNVDTEENFDFVEYLVWQYGSWRNLQQWDGVWRNEAVDITWTLNPSDYVGPDNNQIRLAWHVYSDEIYSDQDCLYDSVGACQLDDVEIFLNGVSVFTDDFQDGDLAGWDLQLDELVGDFAQLWSDLEDVDPDHENASFQVVFIDDGEVVPGTGGTPCVNWCYGPGGWVFNVTAGLDGHGVDNINTGVWNGVVSPPLEWPEEADAGRLAFDVYAHMQTYECGFTSYGWAVRATTGPDPTDLEAVAWEPTRWSWLNPTSMPSGPGYFRLEFRLDDLIPAEATWIQVRLDATEVGPYCWGQYVYEGTPAPYFDNVAVCSWAQVVGVIPAATGPSLAVYPNPFNPRTTVSFAVDKRLRVNITVYDMSGRLVRNLVNEVFDAGAHEAVWDGKDLAGRDVASGAYFIRWRTGDVVEGRKVVLVR